MGKGPVLPNVQIVSAYFIAQNTVTRREKEIPSSFLVKHLYTGGGFSSGKKLFLILLLSLFLAPLVSGSLQESEISDQSYTLSTKVPVNPDVQINSVSSWKYNLSESDKKISSDLLSLIDPKSSPTQVNVENLIISMQEEKNIEISSSTSNLSSTGYNEMVYVYIEMFPGNSTSLVDSWVTTVEARDETNSIMSAWVRLSNIKPISRVDGVRHIYPVSPPFTRTGSVTTEGDAIHKSDLVRALTYGPNGTGIKVGVISDGVDHRNDSISTGDLPANFQVLSNDQGGDEGTAMGEIIYDISPGSDLAFADMSTSMIGMAKHMQDLADAGCRVIVDDVGYFSEPYFEDGVIAQKADSLYHNNTLMVSSAGNDAINNFIGGYVPQNGTTIMDFSSVGNASINPTPNRPNLYCQIPSGEKAIVILQWNDKWGASGNDYDLYLLDDLGNILASSTDVQDGTGDPIEKLVFKNTNSSAINGTIMVNLKSGVPKTLAVMVFSVPQYTNNRVKFSSTYGHPCSAGTIGVAAIPYNNISTIEYFSSWGPRPISYPVVESRLKPDISGIDGVRITGAGGFGHKNGTEYRFYGTSASAPHIAGLGALLWSKNPKLPAGTIWSALTSTAVDLGEPGYDPAFGYGRADALAAYYQLYAPVITGIFPDSGQSGSSVRFNITGENLKDQAVINLTRNSSMNITTTGTLSGNNLTGTLVIPPGVDTGFWNVSVNQNGCYSNDNISFFVTSAVICANFSGSPVTGTPPLDVQFTDESTGQPDSWNWTFGDGASSHVQNPVHQYTGIGRYTVTLEVGNAQGQSVMRKTSYILPDAGRVTGPNGMIWITSSPSGALIFVDGVFIGATPLQSQGIPAGIRQIRLKKEGFGDWNGFVQVRQGAFSYIPKVILRKL